jgi:nanoRNase/pAp phosphatase (c-di-AMP/oligoRNAs hydrolase)
MDTKPLNLLLKRMRRVDQVVVLPHNNPDPDALAAAMALRYLLIEEGRLACRLEFGGIIGRAENKALARYLGISDEPSKSVASSGGLTEGMVLIDTQPGTGNVKLLTGVQVLAVIDNHTQLPGTESVPYTDLRPDYGAVSTVLVEYFQMVDRVLPTPLATALFYGIKTNTLGLSRNASPQDANAYYSLQPQVDVGALGKIEQARVPVDYFKSFDLGLRSARLYNGLVFSDLGEMAYPDLTAEIADLLLRLEQANWVVCIGVHQNTLMVSVRTRRRKFNAEQLALVLARDVGTAGGHGTIAGGQIPLVDMEHKLLQRLLTQRALKFVGLPPDSQSTPLLLNSS